MMVSTGIAASRRQITEARMAGDTHAISAKSALAFIAGAIVRCLVSGGNSAALA
jgi:hypothetical protein